ncbi:hypothetical protein SAMN02745148_00393 [Modicisalibacter ilicicola DSM 19980]|uniref:Uncharacterized protein n=1 Tax=Modicisalibacter ilicicola DSM 19980 TaxID=1121942 RepID=A0A1M4TAT9_9GAMM|nr:hypothetical protein [Halomonas ilicicola]SHE41540.1 hypothetical protein SAMN02745148_00393 [Halomonas ilicicola DSM 19980]
MARWGVLLLIVPVVALMGLYFWELGDIRECQLSGGHWDYLAATCREQPQPFVPFIERHTLMVNGGMLLAMAGLVMCVVGLYVRRR